MKASVYTRYGSPDILQIKDIAIPVPKKNEILFFKTLLEQGKFKPLIDRYYSLEEIPEAFRYVEKGFKVGNVIIRVVA